MVLRPLLLSAPAPRSARSARCLSPRRVQRTRDGAHRQSYYSSIIEQGFELFAGDGFDSALTPSLPHRRRIGRIDFMDRVDDDPGNPPVLEQGVDRVIDADVSVNSVDHHMLVLRRQARQQ